jgi:RimK family alpha-L-glutamate ligase
MRFAVLAAPDSWYARDLMRAAGPDHEIATLPFSQIAAAVVGSTTRVLTGGFRMDCLGRLEAGGLVIMNPARAIEAAVDKFLTTAKLQAAGLLTPRTICCQTADEAMAAFAQLGGDVVLKPLFGSEGRGITRLNDEALALRAFKMLAQLGAVLYLQEFVPHEGHDIRLLAIGERILAMRRHNKLDWRTNISRGASAEAFAPDDALVEISRQAAAAVGAPLAGVDLLPGRDGRLYVIEVNAVPGWKGLAKALHVDVARLVLDFVAAEVRRARR